MFNAGQAHKIECDTGKLKWSRFTNCLHEAAILVDLWLY